MVLELRVVIGIKVYICASKNSNLSLYVRYRHSLIVNIINTPPVSKKNNNNKKKKKKKKTHDDMDNPSQYKKMTGIYFADDYGEGI